MMARKKVRVKLRNGVKLDIPFEHIQDIKLPHIHLGGGFGQLHIKDVDRNMEGVDRSIRRLLDKL